MFEEGGSGKVMKWWFVMFILNSGHPQNYLQRLQEKGSLSCTNKHPGDHGVNLQCGADTLHAVAMHFDKVVNKILARAPEIFFLFWNHKRTFSLPQSIWAAVWFSVCSWQDYIHCEKHNAYALSFYPHLVYLLLLYPFCQSADPIQRGVLSARKFDTPA